MPSWLSEYRKYPDTQSSFGPPAMYLLLTLFATTLALPPLRLAPLKCPLENGNLLDVVLFKDSEEECRGVCQKDPKCIFYHFYEAGPQETLKKRARQEGNENDLNLVENQPSQCFLYDGCNREVLMATDDCPLTK